MSVKCTDVELNCGVVAGSDPRHVLRLHEIKLGQTSCKLSERVGVSHNPSLRRFVPVQGSLWELRGPFMTGSPSEAGLGQRLKARLSHVPSAGVWMQRWPQSRHGPGPLRVSRHWRNDSHVACWEFRKPHCEGIVLMGPGWFYVFSFYSLLDSRVNKNLFSKLFLAQELFNVDIQ